MRRDGFRFFDATNTEWRARGITAFSAVDDYFRGERQRVRDYWSWARERGVNIGRTFNIWGNLDLSPRRPRYFDMLRLMLEDMNADGLWAWPVRYCDQVSGSPVLLNSHEQDAYESELVHVYDGIAMLDEFMNEPWQNGDFAGDLVAMSFPATRGSANDSQLPDAPGSLLDWTTHHTPRGFEQTRKFKEMIDVAKLGFTGWSPSGRPALAGEPPRIAEDDWTDPQRCADYFAGCDLFGNGGVIHGGFGPDGSHAPLQSCIIPTNPNVLACIAAISDVWRNGVPVGTFADGAYLRGTADNTGDLGINHHDRYTDSGENPEGALRTFAMKLRTPDGRDRQVICPIDRGPKWQDAFVMRNGYHLVEVLGSNGNVIIVER